MTETEYSDTQSKVDCGASVHFTEHICVRKNKQDDYELLVQNHKNLTEGLNLIVKNYDSGVQ